MTYNSQIGNYTYPTNGIRPHAVTQAGTNTYIYDANGNMTSGAGRTIAYYYDNMPKSISKSGITTTLVYDYAGQRIKKTVSSVTTVYIGKLYECTSGVCTKYIFGGSQKIASKKQGVVYYYHTDHLGSSSIITDSAGSKAEEIYYYPYGGTRIDTGSISVKHKYTSQELDGETGLYNYGARYYDPILGRFISADSIVPNPFFPQSLNRYSYAYNNPLIIKDADGHFGFLAAIIVGAIVGGTVAAVQGGDFNDILRGALIGAVSGGVGFGVGSFAGSIASSAGTSATVSAVVAGSVGGMAAGATSAALTGGDIGQGMLIGAISGGIGGYIGIQSFSSVYVKGLVQIGSGAMVGGAISEFTGREFWEGFKTGGIASAAAFAASRFFEANTKTGKDGIKQTQKNLTVDSSKSLTFEEWQEANSVLYAENTTDAGGVKLPKINWGKVGTGIMTQGAGYLQIGTGITVIVISGAEGGISAIHIFSPGIPLVSSGGYTWWKGYGMIREGFAGE